MIFFSVFMSRLLLFSCLHEQIQAACCYRQQMNANIRAEDVTFSKDHMYYMFAGPLTAADFRATQYLRRAKRQLTMYAYCIMSAYREAPMPLLQVRDIPEDLYNTLSKVAEAENRSIAQETIVLLKKALNFQQERLSRRKQVLEEIKALNFTNTDSFPNPADLIREDRDR
jgi:hypothetical protein